MYSKSMQAFLETQSRKLMSTKIVSHAESRHTSGGGTGG